MWRKGHGTEKTEHGIWSMGAESFRILQGLIESCGLNLHFIQKFKRDGPEIIACDNSEQSFLLSPGFSKSMCDL